MANMSYCRFANTLEDLRECEDSFDDITSKEELRAAKRLIEVCNRIAQLDPERLCLRVEDDDEGDDA